MKRCVKLDLKSEKVWNARRMKSWQRTRDSWILWVGWGHTKKGEGGMEWGVVYTSAIPNPSFSIRHWVDWHNVGRMLFMTPRRQ